MILAIRLMASALLSVLLIAVAHAQPKRVLVIHSFEPDFGWPEALQAELRARFPETLEIHEGSLISAPLATNEEDAKFAAYLQVLFARRPLDLVITLGAPAADVALKYRQSLFATTPLLLTHVEQRKIPNDELTARDATATFAVDIPALATNILRVLPRTTTIAVVTGKSPLDRYWSEQQRAAFRPLMDHIRFRWLDSSSFHEMLHAASTLPPNSAILLILISTDVPGMPQDTRATIALLHEVANAPLFTFIDTYMGEGIVGGPMITKQDLDRNAGIAAARILAGESPARVRLAPVHLGVPEYDWRELRRWKISDADLPQGSRILFRELTAWERYRWRIIAMGMLLLAETALIVTLLYERSRRRNAESETQRRFAELAHMNRRAAVGELSASMAHELNQPLAAILSNAETAELLLEAPAPRVSELKEIIGDIRRDEQRASDVIKRVRGLLTRSLVDMQEVDLSEAVREVFKLLAAQALAHGTTFSLTAALPGLRVRGDRIQLQQVIMNLAMNGMEAMAGTPGLERRVIARIRRAEDECAEISISDAGPGIPAEQMGRLFNPFFTTKEGGMGMGLSISRTIIEMHGGSISAENMPGKGASFRIRLPLAATDRLTSSRSTLQSTFTQQPYLK